MSAEDLFFLHFRKIVVATVGVAGLIIFNFIGCPGTGDPDGTLSGQVSSGGKPVRWGTVTVVGSDNTPRTATIGADGRYQVSGIPLGPVRISVQSADPSYRIGSSSRPRTVVQPGAKGQPKPASGSGRPGAPPAPGGKKQGNMQAFAMELEQPIAPAAGTANSAGNDWFPIPGRYADPATSGITTTIGPSSGPFDIKAD